MGCTGYLILRPGHGPAINNELIMILVKSLFLTGTFYIRQLLHPILISLGLYFSTPQYF